MAPTAAEITRRAVGAMSPIEINVLPDDEREAINRLRQGVVAGRIRPHTTTWKLALSLTPRELVEAVDEGWLV